MLRLGLEESVAGDGEEGGDSEQEVDGGRGDGWKDRGVGAPQPGDESGEVEEGEWGEEGEHLVGVPGGRDITAQHGGEGVGSAATRAEKAEIEVDRASGIEGRIGQLAQEKSEREGDGERAGRRQPGSRQV